MNQEDIISYIKNNFENIKCINSNKGEYKAIHCYFTKGNNNLYQWELQIWLFSDEEKNRNSHAKYKQAYVKWENERR